VNNKVLLSAVMALIVIALGWLILNSVNTATAHTRIDAIEKCLTRIDARLERIENKIDDMRAQK